MVSIADGAPEAARAARARARADGRRAALTWTRTASPARSARPRTSRATSSSARASAARYYLDKYRFGTRPDLLRPLGERIAAAVAEHEPDAVRLAAPELGAVPLAAAASLESGLPFVIVRGEAKELRHRQPDRGRVRGGRVRLPRRGRRHLGRRGARGGRGAPRGRPPRLARGLRGRPRGGRRRRARAGRASACGPLFRGRGAPGRRPPQERMVERYPTPLLGFRAKALNDRQPQSGGRL